MAKSRDRLYVE